MICALMAILITASLITRQTKSLVLHPRHSSVRRPPHTHFSKCRFARNFSSISIATTKATTKLHSNFLKEVEESVSNVNANNRKGMSNIHNLPPSQRESLGVSNRLSKRINSLHKNNDCPTCWLQRAHCICSQTPPIESLVPPNINRLFMIMHHKEVGLVVDTAKLLLNAMPSRARLVVSGISEEYQDSAKELLEALQQKERKCIVLFPTDNAKTFLEFDAMNRDRNTVRDSVCNEDDNAKTSDKGEKYDVIVMDGTWQQARKIHQRYIPPEEEGGPQRVCLSQESLDILGSIGTDMTESHLVNGTEKGGNGRQLRRHPIKWKEVSTLEATRLLFRDMMVAMDETSAKEYTDINGNQCHDVLSEYQRISDAAAVRQLGPPRERIIKN